MPIKANDTGRFPGAEFVARAPYSAADCTGHATLQALLLDCHDEGMPATMIGGEVMIDAGDGELGVKCDITQPLCTGVTPDPLVVGGSAEASGTAFGAVEGRIVIGDAEIWDACTVRVEQEVTSWGNSAATFCVVRDGLPLEPTPTFLYVENAWLQRSVPGFSVELELP